MTAYKILYTETQNRSIVITANSGDEARRMVEEEDPDIDFRYSTKEDSTIISVDGCQEL